jgi:hypothetical protein
MNEKCGETAKDPTVRPTRLHAASVQRMPNVSALTSGTVTVEEGEMMGVAKIRSRSNFASPTRSTNKTLFTNTKKIDIASARESPQHGRNGSEKTGNTFAINNE